DGRTDRTGEAAGSRRRFLPDLGAPRRSRPRLRAADVGFGDRARKPEDAQGVRGQARPDDRYARGPDPWCSAKSGAQAGGGDARAKEGNGGAGGESGRGGVCGGVVGGGRGGGAGWGGCGEEAGGEEGAGGPPIGQGTCLRHWS